MELVDRVRNHIGASAYESNRLDLDAGDLVRDVALLSAWTDMAAPHNGLAKVVGCTQTLADYHMLLLKLVVGSNSRHFPKDVRRELEDQAVAYPLLLSGHLPEVDSDGLVRREWAIERVETLQSALRMGHVINGVMRNLNHVLFYEVDGLSHAIGPVKNYPVSGTPEANAEECLAARYELMVARDCITFLSGFDGQLAENSSKPAGNGAIALFGLSHHTLRGDLKKKVA